MQNVTEENSEQHPQVRVDYALAPCPFCGEVPTLEHDESLAWILCPEQTICRTSGMVMAFDIELIEQGVAVWNTRKGC